MESYASQLKVYENQVNYATIDLSITEVKTYTTQARDGLFTRMSNGLKHNFEFISNFIKDVLVLLVSAMPTILIFGLFVMIILQSIRLIWQKFKRKKKNNVQGKPKIEK